MTYSMVKTSKKIPVTLVTGLLGSGKTTAVLNLLKYKPTQETWSVLINEFGEIGIDDQLIQQPDVSVEAVSGGCICCTAQFGLKKALDTLIRKSPAKIIIEPTGLGHPAQIIDIIRQAPMLELHHTYCVVNPSHLTPSRWEKSKVMRDLITLADTIILNKTDLVKTETLNTAKSLFANLYPPKQTIITSQYCQFDPSPLPASPPELIYRPIQTTTPSNENAALIHQHSRHQPTEWSIGWIWRNDTQFSRPRITHFFEQFPRLIRAKGLLKTGNEWQLIQYADQQLTFSDQAWRQDSRLDLIFDEPQIEQKLEAAINSTIVQSEP